VILLVLNIAQCRKQIINSWRTLKCGGGGGWRSTVFASVWGMEKFYVWSRRNVIAYIH
jgi:hypothetical protein